MIKLDQYLSGAYPRPDSVNTNPADKDDKYDRDFCEYFYHMWLSGGAAWEYDYRDTIERNRTYWRGEQDINQYKSYLYGNRSNGGRTGIGVDGTDIRDFDSVNKEARKSALKEIFRKGDIASPAPYIRNSIHGMFNESDRRVKVKMTDLNSMRKERRNKWRTWADKQLKGFLDEMYKNIDSENPTDAVELPDSMEELEVMEFNGKFRLNQAKESQKLLSHTEDISDYKLLFEKFTDDMANASVAMARICGYDPNGKAVYEYIDPANSGIQHSYHSDFNDAEWGFTIRLYTISQLSDTGIDTLQLKKAAKAYCNYYGNPSPDSFSSSLEDGSWRSFKVPVLVSSWKDIDVTKKIKYTRKNRKDRYFIKDAPFDIQEEDLKEREELILTRHKKIRESKWIVGTDVVFDNGIMNYMVYEDTKEPELPFRAVRLNSKPITSAIRPYLDDFQISYLWYQNARAHMKMLGYQVNFDLLKGIATEHGSLSELDALEMWDREGTLPVSLINSDFVPGSTSDQAVRELPSGMGNALNEVMIQMNFAMKMISNSTGINLQSLEQSPNEGQNPALDDKELFGMSNSLKPMIDKLTDLKLSASKYALQNIILLIKYDKDSRQAYAEVIGDRGVSLLKEAIAEGSRMGAYLDSKPISQDKRELMQLVQSALQNGRDGKPGIELDDAIYINDMINKNQDPSEVRDYLSIKIRKREQMIAQRSAQNQQLNAQIEQRNKQMEAQVKERELMIEFNNKFKLQRQEIGGKIEIEKIKNGYDDRNDRKRDLPPPRP